MLSTVALWTWTAFAIQWLLPDYTAFEIVIADVFVTIAAIVAWSEPDFADITEAGWLGVSLGGLLASLLFVEISCSGGLQLRASGPYCESYKPGGIGMIFDIAAIALTLAAPACAVRKALERMAL
ncbi:hypothetical protein [Massilia sp. Se16.2.3]|uniref:hypothetical protein n=1 Tax=Massilia sp. Se16.2.3 TaxID=2709303 RepID=UPI001602EE1B|nr:hypothetical protein [Massilia sp. Se16.2.3]QNB00714.1 hypothetical protein G4G31_21010 [Massilia sp. Se16.2.3]